jgi:hypothetical protein
LPKILHSFGEYPAKLENIKDVQSSLGVFGDTYTVTTSPFCPFTRHSAAQKSPHESEAGNVKEDFASGVLFSRALPALCAFFNYARIQQISFYVFPYIHAVVRNLNLFV